MPYKNDKTSTRKVRLIIDATITAKTNIDRLDHEITVKLEKIVGVSVHGVIHAEPDMVMIKKER